MSKESFHGIWLYLKVKLFNPCSSWRQFKVKRMVAFLRKTQHDQHRNAEGNGKRAKKKATGSTVSLQYPVFFTAPFKIMLFFNLLLQIRHKQRFERTSASFDLRLLFWKLQLCLLSSSGRFWHSHSNISKEFSCSQLYCFHFPSCRHPLCSNIIILQPLESNQHLLTCGAWYGHITPGDQGVVAKSTGTCALLDQSKGQVKCNLSSDLSPSHFISPVAGLQAHMQLPAAAQLMAVAGEGWVWRWRLGRTQSHPPSPSPMPAGCHSPPCLVVQHQLPMVHS